MLGSSAMLKEPPLPPPPPFPPPLDLKPYTLKDHYYRNIDVSIYLSFYLYHVAFSLSSARFHLAFSLPSAEAHQSKYKPPPKKKKLNSASIM